MNCQAFDSNLEGFLEGELDPARRAAFEAHARACTACSDLLDTGRELTCREFTEFVGEYFEGNLTGERNAVFERHLSVCAKCRAYLASYKRAVELGKDAFASPGQEVPDEVPEDLVQAILVARRRKT